MAKPDRPPRWATSGAAILEPTEGEKDIGWVAGTRPPASFTNWLERQFYFWTRYLGNVPAANLVKRDATPIPTATDGITLVDAIVGQGAEKFESGPTNRYDEWWLGTDGILAPDGRQLWRYPRGLGGNAIGILKTNSTIADGSGQPIGVLYDGTQYLLTGFTSGGVPTAETSVAGLVWINPNTITGAATIIGMTAAWNEASGAAHRYVVSVRSTVGGNGVDISTDMGVSFSNTALSAGFIPVSIAYSAIADKFCIVGLGGAGKNIWTADGDAAVWVQAVAGTAADANEYSDVTVMDDGEFLIVGHDNAGPDNGAMARSVSGGTIFDTVGPIPDVTAFIRVQSLGKRALVTSDERDGDPTNGTEKFCTYESRQDGINGTWSRVGVVTQSDAVQVAALPFAHPFVMTDEESVIGAGALGLFSEQRTPDLED